MDRITIIGAGRVGEATAQLLAIQELCREVVLIDVRDGAAAGAALDIQESAGLFGFDTRIRGDTRQAAMVDSDLVIVTAGLPRKPGMSRTDVLDANVAVIEDIAANLRRLAPTAKLLMVTNPVDVLTYHAFRLTGWEKNRIVGLSGVLDAARMAAFVCLETGFSSTDVTAMVLGGHGDAMVPLPRYTCVNGIPLDHFLSREVIDRIVGRTREGGAEILALKKTSSAYDAPAAAISAMVDAMAYDRRRILPCVAVLEGEYGQRDLAMGVPCVIGQDGVEKVVELQLTTDEQSLFAQSAAGVRQAVEQIAGRAKTQ